MNWSNRMKIALDAAKGLAFLHGAERSIIYRDFKTSNVLLDVVSCISLSEHALFVWKIEKFCLRLQFLILFWLSYTHTLIFRGYEHGLWG